MKIALISPDRRSGGKIYAERLSVALSANVIPAGPIGPIVSRVAKHRFDVVDIQFEYRTFGSHLRTLVSLPLLTFLLSRITAPIVTVHGVLTYQSLKGQRLRFFKWIAFVLSVRLAAAFTPLIIVHTQEMRRKLNQYGLREVTVIPHGSGPLEYQAPNSSRTSALFFGFIRPSKGIDVLIEGFRKVVDRFPDATLTIAGSPSIQSESSYLRTLFRLVQRLDMAANVYFRNGFIPEAEKRSLAAQAGILVLPYTDTYLEASGVVHDFSGYGVSLVCSQTPRFGELLDGFDCLKVAVTASQLAESICRLLADEHLRERLARNLSRLAETESWDSVATIRSRLYERVIRRRELLR